MKQAKLIAIGDPASSVRCEEVPAPGEPGAGQVLVDVAAAPINPAEVLIMKGEYAATPDLPAPLGIEGAGIVAAVGAGVSGFAAGDKVMIMPRANWAQQVLVGSGDLIKLPPGIDMRQAAMLKVNPATAFLMLKNYVTLSPGDWVIQNSANSGVGTSLIRIAKQRGLKTVNIVRRQDAADYCTGIGGDVAVIDGDDVAARVAEATGGAAIKLGIDAVAGEAVIRLAACLADGGMVVNYGMLSGKPCMMTTDQTVFQSKTLTGFWLAKVLGGMDKAGKDALYGELAPLVEDGTINVPVEAAYPIEQVREAVAHACREGRGGKILVLPNG